MAGKGGRKRKPGDRYPGGQLRPVFDHGNARVQAHRDPYLRAGKVKAGDDLHCALGQAHAAGLLEGTRVDGRVLLEHGREWHRVHDGTFGGAVRTSNLERVGRCAPGPCLPPTSIDTRYRSWAFVVAMLTPLERYYLNLVAIEYGDSWNLPPFLERLVNRWKAKQRPPLYAGGYLPVRGDEDKLDALKTALLSLAEGSPAKIRLRRNPAAATRVAAASADRGLRNAS